MIIENKEVVEWLSGAPTSFIGGGCTYKSKNDEMTKRYLLEVEWARPIFAAARPDLHPKTDRWSGTFGQEIFKEMRPAGWTPRTISGFALDWEDSDYVYEVKTQFHFSGGTAQEKIAAVPIKYMNVPDLFGKPLRIVCLAGAETYAKVFFKDCEKTKSQLALWKEWGIEYVWGSEVIKDLGRQTPMSDFVLQPMFTYLGNKRKLLDFIEKTVIEVKELLGNKEKIRILDGFTGSTVVARMLASHASELHTNDLELYSLVAAKCFLEHPTDEQSERVRAHLERMNALTEFTPGIITDMYAPSDTQNVQAGERCFFTHENALRVDTWRRYVEDHVEEDIKHWCLCPVLIQMSLKANTYGHFKAFSKNSENIGSFEKCGDRVTAPMVLQVPIFNPNACAVHCHHQSTNDLLERMPNNSIDLIYLDPPYNEHEYSAFYFLHNVVCKNERPVNVNAVTGLPKERVKSAYNNRIEAARAMRQLLEHCTRVARYTLISYNDEGIIGHAGWLAILEPYTVRRIEHPYTRYSANTKKEKEGRKEVMELLYLIS